MAATSERRHFSFAQLLRWTGLIGIASIAVLRCLVLLAPQLVFDADQDPTPLAGLAAPASMGLDALLLISCAIALIGEWRSGRRIDWLLLLLALIPMPVIAWHGMQDGGGMWRGSTWLAAAVACVTIAHLARDRVARIVLISLLVAAVAPVLARGASQVTAEHAASVQYYQAHKAEILASHGWSPDSSAVRIYERRLFQSQPTGWFTTSNIFASLAAFGLITWVGLGWAASRAGMQSGWIGAMLLCAIVALAGLVFSGSKGAILAALGGSGVLILDFGFWILDSRRRHGHGTDDVPESKIQNPKFRIGAVAVCLVLLALIAVVIRGVVLPEGFIGERSLLFRWHYAVASTGILSDHFAVGVGPDGYQAAYMLHRLPRSPEEVASAHCMFWDWLCALGFSGAAWIALVMKLLWRARPVDVDISVLDDARLPRSAILSTLAVAALALVPAMLVERPTLDGSDLMVRVLGMLAFIAVALMSASIMARSPRRIIGLALIAAVTALVIHGQIEMTFHQPGSAVWAMSALGLLGGARDSSRSGLWRSSAAAAIIGSVAFIWFAAWLAKHGVFPALAQQRVMLTAAAQLPAESQPTLQQRRAASEFLTQAYELWPVNVAPLEAATLQLQLAAAELAQDQRGEPPLGLLMEAQDLIERAVGEHGKPSSIAIAISVDRQLAQATGDREHWARAIALARHMTELDPNGLSAWRRLGDLQWDAGERAQAAKAYQRALECDANFALDKEKQLSAEQRAEVTARIQKGSGL